MQPQLNSRCEALGAGESDGRRPGLGPPAGLQRVLVVVLSGPSLLLLKSPSLKKQFLFFSDCDSVG